MLTYRRHYCVHGILEEFTCRECGCPVVDGDDAVDDEKMGQVYCSERCSNEARDRAEEEIARESEGAAAEAEREREQRERERGLDAPARNDVEPW